jgi:hypothetical protein
VPKLFPNASPRRVAQLGFISLFAGIVTLLASLEVGVGAEVITWPMLLAGLGMGALASQLGSVTVSAVPDNETAEVGGVQNTVTFMGAAIGTALAGAVLISALSTSFFTGIQENAAVPEKLSSQAQVELAAGVPFIADDELSQALADAGVDEAAAAAIIEENEEARIAGLRAALSVLAVIALIAMFFTSGLPARQPVADV